MGLQTWPPSKPPLSSMACLDVETPSICRGKFKSVLQLCLQQRRTRKQLVEQGIMAPLKTPAAFHEQIRSLERARTGNFLKHKLCSRPERAELVRMHILQETQAEPALQATQMKLKRARLADDLNEKIAQRPGPMELVEKNILPVDSSVKDATEGDTTNHPKTPDVYTFDEDSSDGVSPERPSSQDSPSIISASPGESGGTETASVSSNSNLSVQHSPPPNSRSTTDFVSLASSNEQQGNQRATTPQPIPAAGTTLTTGPVLVKQSLSKTTGDKSRSKKSKEPKPRIKKLKYHQYIPPDQKQELNDVPMDSAYARLLQQQQQFLQLQILSQQQQQQYSYQAVLPVTHKSTAEAQTSCSSAILSGNTASAPAQPRHTQISCKPDHLPANLDEMKVAELKMELKLRSLPVSGTKTDLIERLKLYHQESSNMQTAVAAIPETKAATVASQSENTRLTPPVSPIASQVSSMGLEDSSMADSPTKLSDALSPAHAAPCVSSPQRAPQDEGSTEARANEKDKRLHEKERQIEELKRKLEQEQKLVEELKLQLEVEKRSQQGDSPPRLSPLAPIQVKEENKAPSSCSASPGLPVVVKQEEAGDHCYLAPPDQFIIAHPSMKQPETQQLSSSISLHATVSSVAPGLIQTSGQVPHKIEALATPQQQCSAQPLTKTWRMDAAAQSLLNTFPVTGQLPGGACPVLKGAMSKSPHASQTALILQHPKFADHVPKCRDPPRYEDAIKQTRMLVTAQGSSAASQQMDDLFDVLIESGEISPFIKQDPPSLDKRLPVTASVTTLPINTVLSRPPPLVQVAQLPADTQLGTLLDGPLGPDTEPQALKLMEELHSPLVTMELDFNESIQPSAVNLHNSSVDNMDWLDLTLSVAAEEGNTLDMATPVGVFSTDFLDSHELHLNWD